MINVTVSGSHKVVQDDINQRIYSEEWKCSECREWTDSESVIWALDSGELSVASGKPWCEACAPEQPEEQS